MMAKVIASAETRGAAIARLSSALREFPILGIRTNIPFLLRILDHPRFRAGTVDTAFLDGAGASLAEIADEAPPAFVLAVLEAHRAAAESRTPNPESRSRATGDPWSTLAAWGR
jgi:3-methylcrotonyl-CoA carboxylase alpha subunit